MDVLGGKQLDDITEGDLQLLVENRIAERRVVDYKSALPAKGSGARRELLADVASFANAAGGHIIFGMEEEGGVPTRLGGLSATNSESGIQRIESMLRGGVAPRIPGIDTVAVPLADGSSAVVMRVPRSWAGPHMVTFDDLTRFYSRASNGKYVMSVDEVRAAFDAAGNLAQNLRAFRGERQGLIASEQTPVALSPGPKCVFHIIPAGAFSSVETYDLNRLSDLKNDLGPLLGRSGEDLRHNFDGMLICYFSARSHAVSSYCQVFRSGIIEGVGGRALVDSLEERTIGDRVLTELLGRSARQYFAALHHLDVPAPLYVMLSFLDVRGYTLASVFSADDEDALRIDRDDLLMAPEAMDTYPGSALGALRPLLDQLWQSVGRPRCPYYDGSGRPTAKEL